MTKHTVRVESTVIINISDESVLSRLDDPEFVKDWGFKDVEHVLEHFAYNAVANGATDVDRLDGWADVNWDAVRMNVEVDYINVD